MIITGEKIQNECDLYIGRLEDFRFNPFIINQKNKQVVIDKVETYELLNKNINLLFCYTHILDIERNRLIHILNLIKTPFCLIFHNSDGGFKQQDIDLFKIKNLKKIFTQNLEIEPQENLIPIPIGIANRMWPHGNISIWNIVLSNSHSILKTNNIFFNFTISTNKTKRTKCYDIISKKGIENLPNRDYQSYLYLLSSYKFAICPEGNGLDTHRLWESLYLKTIPICLKNPITNYYSKLFPIYLLDDWNDLDLNKLDHFYNESLQNWEKTNYRDNLNFNYFITIFA